MQKESIPVRVLKIIGEQTLRAPESIKVEDELLRDQYCDSLDCIEIAMALETEFGIDLDEDKFTATTTVQQVIDNVTELHLDRVPVSAQTSFEKAQQIHFRLLPLFKGIFIETNPIPIKAALAMKGMIKESYRLPMCEMKSENREKLRQILKDLKIL